MQGVEDFLKKNKITDFLEGRGIFPDRKSSDRYVYKCPIHGDTEPSFIVYPEGVDERPYQTYYCFGCGSGISLFNLKADLDKISIKDSFKFFVKNINFDNDSILNEVIDDIKNDKIEGEKKEIELEFLLINRICKEHIKRNNDEEEVAFFEDFFKKLDKAIYYGKLDLILDIKKILIRGLESRCEKFKEREKEKRFRK